MKLETILETVKCVARSPKPMRAPLLVLLLHNAHCFTIRPALRVSSSSRSSSVSMNFFEKFLKEVDNFADDAVGRRLGNGAKFYGKRKSSFYGEDDALKKENPDAYDKEEDYSGPMGGSFFVLSKEVDENGRPMGFLTRGEARALKEKEESEYWQQQRSSEEMLSSFKDASSRDDGVA